MRKLLASIFLVVFLAVLLPGDAEIQESSVLGFFHAEGKDLVADATGEKVAFRGVNLNGLEYGSFFDNPYPGIEGTNYFKPRLQDFDAVATDGFNVIRVPFEWARLVTGWRAQDPLPLALNASYLAVLDEVVQRASVKGIYVVLDMHDFLKYWSGESSEICVNDHPDYQHLLVRTWQLLAAHYQNNPTVLGYDIMNEPVRYEPAKTPPEPCGSCDWPIIAQTVVDGIRQTDRNHLIFIEGPNYSLASDWPVENPEPFLTDSVSPPRIVYSPHVFFDANNDSLYDQEGEENGPLGNWQYYVRDRLMAILDWSVEHEVPIFLGEVNVPCTTDWASVLDHAYRNFFDPTRISVTAWHYIDPSHCLLATCPLNLAACQSGYQMEVLRRYPGGTYSETGKPLLIPSDSLIYGDSRVNPWDAGEGHWGDVGVNTICIDPPTDCFLSVQFWVDNYAGVKFMHRDGIDTRRFNSLNLTFGLGGNKEQNFKIFTTTPRGDCETGPDPEYPSYAARPALREFEFLVSPKPLNWYLVKIPLNRIVDPQNPIINGIAFQNMGSKQDIFYITEVSLGLELPYSLYLPLVLK